MLGVVVLSWSIALCEALESIFLSLLLISCLRNIFWSRIRIFPTGWWFLISSSISKLIFPARLSLLPLLILIAHSLRGCKQALVPISPRHLLLRLPQVHLPLVIHFLPWRTRWTHSSLVPPLSTKEILQIKKNFVMTSHMFAQSSGISSSAMTSLTPRTSGLFPCLRDIASLFLLLALNFDPWIAPSDRTDVHRLVIDPPNDPLFAPDPDFIEDQEWSHLFYLGGDILEFWRPWEIILRDLCVYVYLFMYF